jgi:4-oxalocrotonate tautomerase
MRVTPSKPSPIYSAHPLTLEEITIMPIVHVHMWPGRDADQKRILIEGITRVFQDLDIPAEVVNVLIHEVPKDAWGEGGMPATKRYP